MPLGQELCLEFQAYNHLHYWKSVSETVRNCSKQAHQVQWEKYIKSHLSTTTPQFSKKLPLCFSNVTLMSSIRFVDAETCSFWWEQRETDAICLGIASKNGFSCSSSSPQNAIKQICCPGMNSSSSLLAWNVRSQLRPLASKSRTPSHLDADNSFRFGIIVGSLFLQIWDQIMSNALAHFSETLSLC